MLRVAARATPEVGSSSASATRWTAARTEGSDPDSTDLRPGPPPGSVSSTGPRSEAARVTKELGRETVLAGKTLLLAHMIGHANRARRRRRAGIHRAGCAPVRRSGGHDSTAPERSRKPGSRTDLITETTGEQVSGPPNLSDLLLAKLATRRVDDPSDGMAVEPSALLSIHRVYAQAAVAGRICRPAFPRREVSWPKSAQTCSSPVAQPTDAAGAHRGERSLREPCSSTQEGAAASWLPANADRPCRRSAAARRLDDGWLHPSPSSSLGSRSPDCSHRT